MRYLLRILLPTLLAGVTFVACASTSGSSATGSPTVAGKTAAVTIKGFAFAPATLTVDKGTVVTFANQDSTTHTVTSGANRAKDGKFDQQLSGGTEATITFDAPGTFVYFCSIHSTMTATVVVK